MKCFLHLKRYSNPKDYIFGRTIGRHTKEAANYIAKDVEGYVNDNFTCTLKHFPGYGNNSDTHTGISIDDRTYEIFQDEDLKVFQAGINNKAPIVLVSHNIVTCKDNKYPASLSKIWHDILRNELNFSGLIMTDDISMGAIKKYADNVSLKEFCRFLHIFNYELFFSIFDIAVR